MDLCWIKPTSELKEAIDILNELDNSKFNKFLNHIKTFSSERPKNEIFTADEVSALEKIFKTNSDNIYKVIKATLHILERMLKFLMCPSDFVDDLTNHLNLKKEKAESFVNVWKQLIQDIQKEFEIKNFGDIEKLTDSNWQVNLAISSHINKTETLSTALFELDKSKNRIFLEMTSDELLAFNSQLESAQLELDTILCSSLKEK